MPRIPRNTLGDGFFHVTVKGAGGAMIFRDEVDRAAFMKLLRYVAGGLGWRVHAYCLMGTHYHLVVETTQPLLSEGMHILNGAHAQRFNRRHERWGHLFGERFSARLIESEEHFNAAVEYVLDNPVRAGLCGDRDDWRWSGRSLDGRRPWPVRFGRVQGTVPRTRPGETWRAKAATARPARVPRPRAARSRPRARSGSGSRARAPPA